MFADYKLRVLEDYELKKDAKLLPLSLTMPTPAKLRAESIQVCNDRYNDKDKIILRRFFGEAANKTDCLRAIDRFDINRFRPLVNYLRQNTSETDDKNIELLAWLIDFGNRPYDFSKNYDPKMLAPKDKLQNQINIVGTLHFKIFLSYSWANTGIADEIDRDFKRLGIQFIRDVRDAKYRTSIKDFMHQVGKSDFVLMIISDEYLRSDNCMYEVNELLNTHDFEQRILPIAIENAVRIFKPISRKEYYRFWQEKKVEADKNKAEFPNHDTIDYAIKCQRIVDNLPDFFQKITDLNVSTFKKLKEGNYIDVLRIIGFNDRVEDRYERSRALSHDLPEKTNYNFQEAIFTLLSSFASLSTKVLIVGNDNALWTNITDRSKNELKHILQELMSNMHKHSGARNVLVGFTQEGDHLNIRYADDGVGLPANPHFGNGLTNTENRIKEIGGRIIFARNVPIGLNIEIYFPIESCENDPKGTHRGR